MNENNIIDLVRAYLPPTARDNLVQVGEYDFESKTDDDIIKYRISVDPNANQIMVDSVTKPKPVLERVKIDLRPKIIILNGPPGSGKDTIANKLVEVLPNTLHYRFKKVIYDEFIKEFEITREKLDEYIDDYENKNMPRKELRGMSFRQALIHTSENILKKKYGEDVVGKLTADNLAKELIDLNNLQQFVVFSDGGFVSELIPMLDTFGTDNVIVIRIVRDGTSFAFDSRDYLTPSHDIYFKSTSIYNDSSVEDAVNEVIKIIKYYWGGYARLFGI